jgi:predicted nucleic acid-binding protein
MILIADCSALIALASCDGLTLLELLYGQVYVPEEVFKECTVAGKPEAAVLAAYLKEKVKPVNLSALPSIEGVVDAGELQAMQLYFQLAANNLLIDDRRGKKIAMQNQINTIGSLTVLLEAKQAKLITHIKPYIEAIRVSSVFVADSVLDTALRIADEL